MLGGERIATLAATVQLVAEEDGGHGPVGDELVHDGHLRCPNRFPVRVEGLPVNELELEVGVEDALEAVGRMDCRARCDVTREEDVGSGPLAAGRGARHECFVLDASHGARDVAVRCVAVTAEGRERRRRRHGEKKKGDLRSSRRGAINDGVRQS